MSSQEVDSPAEDEIDARIWDARTRLGLTWREVSKAVGLSIEPCHTRYFRMLARSVPPDEVQALRNEEVVKLEDIEGRLRAILISALKVEDLKLVLQTTDRLVKISGLRSRLLGLDRANEAEVMAAASLTPGSVDDEIIAAMKRVQGAAVPVEKEEDEG